jgi:hypothetical protein
MIMEVIMKKNYSIVSLFIISGLLISACGSEPAVEEQPAVIVEQDVMVDEDHSAEDASPDNNMEDQAAQPESSFPAWYSAPLTDVNTGAIFTIEESLGKVFLVETLATWCSNCYRQQLEVAGFHELLGERDDFESLGVDIDPNEDVPLLTGYVRKNGFDWLYVVASNEMIDEISSLYGPQFLNPPSTPMLIIDKQGNFHPLGFGLKSAQDLLDAVTPFL